MQARISDEGQALRLPKRRQHKMIDHHHNEDECGKHRPHVGKAKPIKPSEGRAGTEMHEKQANIVENGEECRKIPNRAQNTVAISKPHIYCEAELEQKECAANKQTSPRKIF